MVQTTTGEKGLPRRWGAGCGPMGAAAVVIAALASAPSARATEPHEKPDLWHVTVGSWAVLEPKFEGARSHDLDWRPILNIRRAGEREWIVLPNDGFDIEIVETDNFRAGPVANWRWLRNTDGLSPRGFRQVGNIDLSIEAGAFAEFWPAQWLRTRVEVRNSLIGGEGWIADVTSDVVLRPAKAWTVTGGPRVSLADGDFMRTYYGVTPQQALSSGLPVYNASAGVRSYGAGSMVKYNWNEAWSTMGFVEYQRLAGAAADSPVIDVHGTHDQVTVGLGLSYSFTIGK